MFCGKSKTILKPKEKEKIIIMKKKLRKNHNNRSKCQIPRPCLQTGINYCKNLTILDLEDPQNAWLAKIMSMAPTVTYQIPYILLSIQTDEAFYDKAKQHCQMLQKVFNDFEQFESVSVKLFGSAKTGLALKGSDVDLFAEFGDDNFKTEIRIVILECLLKAHDFAEEVIAIKGAIPSLKYKVSNTPFKIAIKNGISKYNSYLIRYLVSLDERIKALIVILKFWLKKQGLLNKEMISSYALTLLVIFYLQQLQNLLIYPIYKLQYGFRPIIVDNWNVAFATLATNLKSDLSFFDLLKGFFKFYSNFDYENDVICPYVGVAVPKNIIDIPDLLPKHFSIYKKNFSKDQRCVFWCSSVLCVQDPFVHVSNVTENMNAELTAHFKDICRLAFCIAEKGNFYTHFFEELFMPVLLNFPV